MDLEEYLHGGYLVGIEKRNPNIEVVDTLLSKEEAEKRVKDLNQTDRENGSR